MENEQRKNERLIPLGNMYGVLGRYHVRVGRVKDISLGGLAIEYIANDNSSSTHTKIDIFLAGDVFNLNNVPCKIVYDISMDGPHEKMKFIKPFASKRCGVQFGNLNDDEIAQLKFFLRNHTSNSTSQPSEI